MYWGGALAEDSMTKSPNHAEKMESSDKTYAKWTEVVTKIHKEPCNTLPTY